ncbi:MAG: PCRF domain-containing protein, partial [Betaproteobacteria bacterium]
MKPSLAHKLTQLAARLHELDSALAAEDVTRDLDRFRALSREHAEIAPVVSLYRDWEQANGDLGAAQDMQADAEMRAFGDDEVKAAKARMETLEAELQSVLLPRDPNDERNIFLEIRAGTGGDE